MSSLGAVQVSRIPLTLMRADKFVGIPGAVAMVAVGTGVSVGGMGVLVAVDTGVLVADGTGVSVGGTGVWVGGKGVAVGSSCCCCCTMRKSPGLTSTVTKLDLLLSMPARIAWIR